MRKHKTISVQKKIVEEVHCNKCGNPISKDHHGNFEEYLHVEVQWGYFSNRDGQKHQFDICQKCYEEWIKTFVIPHNEE